MAHCWLMFNLMSTRTLTPFSVRQLSYWVAPGVSWCLGLFLPRWGLNTSLYSTLWTYGFKLLVFSSVFFSWRNKNGVKKKKATVWTCVKSRKPEVQSRSWHSNLKLGNFSTRICPRPLHSVATRRPVSAVCLFLSKNLCLGLSFVDESNLFEIGMVHYLSWCVCMQRWWVTAMQANCRLVCSCFGSQALSILWKDIQEQIIGVL